MVPVNAYSILREDLKQHNDQLIYITKISPRYNKPKQGMKERNRSANPKTLNDDDNKNNNNNNQMQVQFLNDIKPQQGIDIINKHMRQLEKIQEQQYQESAHINGKISTNELDRKNKLFNPEKSPLNKQMLISRFIQRNQKELDQHYEKNIEDDLRKPIGLRTFNSDCNYENTEKDITFQINTQLSHQNKQQNGSFHSTITNFRKNRSTYNKQQNKSMTSPHPLDASPDINMQSNGKVTPGLNKKFEESIPGMIITTPNTIYSQNVYNRIILKQTERKRIKLQSIGQVPDNMNKDQLVENTSRQKLLLVKQSSYQENQFYNPESGNMNKQASGKSISPNKQNAFHNLRSDSCVNPNHTPQTTFYQIEQPSYSCSPNKLTNSKTRPQTQQNRRRIYSSHQQHLLVQNKNSHDVLNGVNSATKIHYRAISPAQGVRNNQAFSGNIQQHHKQQHQQQQRLSQSFISKGKERGQQTQYSTLFQISSYNIKNTNNSMNHDNINSSNAYFTQEDDNQTQRQNQSEFMNLNRKRQGVLKQMNDYKQKINRDKEIKQQEIKLRKNISMKAKELIIEAVGLNTIKQPPLNQIQTQNVTINNNHQFFQKCQGNNDGYNTSFNTFENETNPNVITLNDSHNISIHQIQAEYNTSLAELNKKMKNTLNESNVKTMNSLECNLSTATKQPKSPYLKDELSNNNLYGSINESNRGKESNKAKDDEGSKQLRKSIKNASKYEIIKRQIETEKKRKKMQEIISEEEIDYQRRVKKKHLQNLYTRFLNQQGFTLYVNDQPDPLLPSDNSPYIFPQQNASTRIDIQDSPNIKKLVKYYDNKYGDKFEQQINSNNQSQETFQNQTFGLFDQDVTNNENKNLYLPHQSKQKKKIFLPKERIIEMGPWISQNEEDQEEQFPINRKNV